MQSTSTLKFPKRTVECLRIDTIITHGSRLSPSCSHNRTTRRSLSGFSKTEVHVLSYWTTLIPLYRHQATGNRPTQEACNCKYTFLYTEAFLNIMRISSMQSEAQKEEDRTFEIVPVLQHRSQHSRHSFDLSATVTLISSYMQ